MGKEHNNKNYWIWLAILAALVFVGIFKSSQRNSLQHLSNLQGAKTIKKLLPQQLIQTEWYGKEAPDFTVTDLQGNEHKLSDYRGREVILVFWATWCSICRVEIPDLIDLSNEKSPNELKILAISYEKPETVANFANGRNINYTIATAKAAKMPIPYRYIPAFPVATFVSSDGKIKATVLGAKDISVSRALIEAEYIGETEKN